MAILEFPRFRERLSAEASSARPRVLGKFLMRGDEKLYVRGVTYGTFRPLNGSSFPEAERVAADFDAMVANGINSVRTYEAPPRWLLDLAAERGLLVFVGLTWPQHTNFLDAKKSRREVEDQVRAALRTCAGHPAVLAYAIGNEVPASVVRWYGRRRVERFLRHLYSVCKQEDPGALVTYVNYPSTEYLNLDFVDFLSFNVYLESPERLSAYLARLQNLAGERPLLMAEIGLDSDRNGLDGQAASLDWQVRTAFEAGCTGTYVFAWTDEWYRGGSYIEDWSFGLTDRQRSLKPALNTVRDAYACLPFETDTSWPFISVVVCSYNGSRTIRDCLEGLARVEYPNFEVIVVNDGSKDATPLIAAEFDVRLISTENRGLSNARNTGMAEARGEIVAYTDDDARPDPHWLHYLAHSFRTTDHVAVGGPNLAPPGDGLIADCVANSPGGPVQVLIDDTTAEHIPGCNMAFRRENLMAIGGFDPRYRTAGDDVDVCWRLQERGWTIGFNHAALVWHHRRNSVKTYWKQQQGYGRAEALLEQKWPERYNPAGHTAWAGRLYGKGLTRSLQLMPGRVYHGTYGSAPYQSVYEPAEGVLTSLPLMPEWFLLLASLLVFASIGAFWTPLLTGSLVAFGLCVSLLLAEAVLSARRGVYTSIPPRGARFARLKLHALTAVMHVMQPLSRLRGRIRWGLTLWRHNLKGVFALPLPGRCDHWSGEWADAPERLSRLAAAVKERGGIAYPLGDYERWDLEVRGGILGNARVRQLIEEHGNSIQRLRVTWRPRVTALAVLAFGVPALVAAAAFASGAWVAGGLLCAIATVVVLSALRDAGLAVGAVKRGLGRFRGERS